MLKKMMYRKIIVSTSLLLVILMLYLIPNNKESKMAQELAFNMLEKYQLEYIQAYNVMTKKYRIRKSHQICYYFAI